MENKNKIYARVNKDGIVTLFFSSVFETPLETDKLIEEGNEDYHAHVHLKYQLRDNDLRYNYKYENDKLILLTDEEKEVLFPKEEVVSISLEERIATLESMILESL